jgi:hypothetical protein
MISRRSTEYLVGPEQEHFRVTMTFSGSLELFLKTNAERISDIFAETRNLFVTR